MAASLEGSGSLRSFSGDTEDAKEYRRWKVWVLNKLLTLEDKVQPKARGAYIYTLLSGKALECVEHLDPSSYQKEGGEKVLLDRLDKRFPQKDTSDEMSETLTEIFNLKAADGESLKTWISRASELFEKCERKVNVTFPEEARGWLILNRSGLTDEQKAVVLARSLGVLKREEIGRAMRSCYPDFVVKKKNFGAGMVEGDFGHTATEGPEHDDDPDLSKEVESFLAEHNVSAGDVEEDEIYDEREVAEALAISWKDRRQELNKLQRTRKFAAASDLKRSYRVEIAELKRRTKCHRCGAVGHWSKECTQPKAASSSQGHPHSSAKREAGAALVTEASDLKSDGYAMWDNEDFVAMAAVVPPPMSTLDMLRQRHSDRLESSTVLPEVLLVSSPGYGILDSGCGRSIIGRQTLQEFQRLWKAANIAEPPELHEVNHFRFGNGEKETTHTVIRLPVFLGGKKGTIRTAIVRGHAPFLISRNALQTLKAVIDFGQQQLTLFDEKVVVPLSTNEAGQFAVNVIGETVTPDFEQEVMCTHPEPSTVTAEFVPPARDDPEPSDSASLQSWFRDDSFLHTVPTIGKQGPLWKNIVKRKVTNLDTGEVLFNEQIDPQKGKAFYRHDIPEGVLHTRTEFVFKPQETCSTLESLPIHYVRQLRSQVSKLDPRKCLERNQNKGLTVAEVFCPPRFAPLVQTVGGKRRSFDLTTGFDFTQAATRDAVAQELKDNPPDLLIVCPPCTDESGWFNINSLDMTPQEVAFRIRQSRLFVRFSCQLFQQQLDAGRQALFEHPRGSRIWHYPEVQALVAQAFPLECDFCRFGLRIPGSDKLIRKPTRLLVSHESMNSLERRCPGPKHKHHVCHQEVAGSHPTVGSVSHFTGKYTPSFVQAVMNTVAKFQQLASEAMPCCVPWSYQHEHDVFMVKKDLDQEDDEGVKSALVRLHKNLGHPSNSDLVRLLKHAQASERAMTMARQLHCDFCLTQGKPRVPLPAQVDRPQSFNQVVGIDVKNLKGWKPNQTIKALNVVDHASNYQLMLPFHEQETSQVLQRLFSKQWVKVFGPPQVLVMDPARTNLGEPMQTYAEVPGPTGYTVQTHSSRSTLAIGEN